MVLITSNSSAQFTCSVIYPQMKMSSKYQATGCQTEKIPHFIRYDEGVQNIGSLDAAKRNQGLLAMFVRGQKMRKITIIKIS